MTPVDPMSHSLAAFVVPPTLGVPPDWFSEAVKLDHAGRSEQALDLLYRSVDAAFKGSRFGEIDALLGTVPSLSVDILLGLLTTTWSAKSQLPSRGSFFRKAEESLKQRGRWQPGLLDGLD